MRPSPLTAALLLAAAAAVLPAARAARPADCPCVTWKANGCGRMNGALSDYIPVRSPLPPPPGAPCC